MYSDPPAWKQLLSPTLATHKRIPLITTIYSTSDEVEIARNLFGDDAQTFVDVIDEVSIHTFSPQQDESVCPLFTLLCPIGQSLDSLPPRIHRRCLHSLYNICGRKALLPRSLAIPLCYSPTENPLCHGAFADLWKGQYRGRDVAAKTLRVYSKGDVGRIRRVGHRCSRHVMDIKDSPCPA